MIADRLRALVAELRAQADHEQQALEHFIAHAPIVNCDAVVAALRERLAIADRLDQILAEDAGGWRPVQISSGWSDGAGLMEPSTWIVVLCADGSIWRRFDCDMIWTRIPSSPPQEPQP